MNHDRGERLRCLSIVAVMLIQFVKSEGDFATYCPNKCQCKWQSGNKAADCTNGSLSEIPRNMSDEIQYLYLTNNPLHELRNNAFTSAKLVNLKKLFLRECHLEVVHKNAFFELGIMIELDMSKNNITKLDPDLFITTFKLRVVILSNNKIVRLEDGLFRNLEYLQKVDLSDNQIITVGVNTFSNLPMLSTIRLNGNNLTHLKVECFSHLDKLWSLDLHDNSWKCDCSLQSFRNWVINHNLYTPPTACSEPQWIAGKQWNDLKSDQFACKPKIISPKSGTVVMPTDENITITCKVTGNPLPEVKWLLNSRVINSEFRKHSDQRYIITENVSDKYKWHNLTILQAKYHDRGDFKCVAQNSAGVEETTISLIISRNAAIAGAGVIDGDMMPMVIGIVCTAIIVIIGVAIFCYCFCRKRRYIKRHIKSDVHSPNGDALIEGSVIPEMEKSLITAVNPVTKPPRRYDAPPSVTSGGTEMSELNKTLLDNESVFAPNEEESRSLDFDRGMQKRSHETLSMEYGKLDNRAYPPDLLAFPPQVSPAASTASTAPDNTRLPPQSPIHSPIYGTNPNIFRTLPYSRSQSPFTSPVVPTVVTPRQGYVTIPRRPRVPSWSSTTSTIPTSVLPTSEAQEPLYDNLGLRTTADGSSVLSLNKAGVDRPFSPMKGRPLPATPTSGYHNPPPVLYAPIEEHEPAPSPAPGTPYNSTPRASLSSPNIHHQLSIPPNASSTPQEVPNPRMSWAQSPPDPLPRLQKKLFNGIDSGSLRNSPSKANDSLFNDSGNIFFPNGMGTLGRSGKIPPRPPPKPKKKTTESNEPLFEDEGEDGTEV